MYRAYTVLPSMMKEINTVQVQLNSDKVLPPLFTTLLHIYEIALFNEHKKWTYLPLELK